MLACQARQQMSHGCVDGDDEVQFVDDCRRVSEVGDPVVEQINPPPRSDARSNLPIVKSIPFNSTTVLITTGWSVTTDLWLGFPAQATPIFGFPLFGRAAFFGFR